MKSTLLTNRSTRLPAGMRPGWRKIERDVRGPVEGGQRPGVVAHAPEAAVPARQALVGGEDHQRVFVQVRAARASAITRPTPSSMPLISAAYLRIDLQVADPARRSCGSRGAPAGAGTRAAWRRRRSPCAGCGSARASRRPGRTARCRPGTGRTAGPCSPR